MKKVLNKLAISENGATALKYGLIAGFIAFVIVSGTTAFGSTIEGMLEDMVSSFSFSTGTSTTVGSGNWQIDDDQLSDR